MDTKENSSETSSAPKIKTGQEIDVEINDIGFGGRGVGRIDGVACFVPGVIEKEKVRVKIAKVKSRMMEAWLLEVLEPSPYRVEPPCPVFLKCGGCSYQHIDYPHQLQIKETQLREALRRLGGLSEPPVLPMIASPEPYGYRNRIAVHVRDGNVGFFAEGSNRVIPVKKCLIASPEVDLGFQDLLKERPRDGDYLIGEKKRYGGFRQVNNAVAEILKETVREAVRPSGEAAPIAGLLVDAYCGAGFFAHELQELFTKVIGIERSIASVAMASRQAAENEEYLAGDVELKLSEALGAGKPEETVLLLDPPSEGLAELAMEAILQNPPARIVYVSCNPATLARDAKRLAGNYRLVQVTPLDMFPQTAEIESVSVFKLIP
ncbi:MAG: class I SAM-dependent RNA methyltransferase [Verrucomicrobia bacterium]|nr:class I SAM-dependent RNA methyltransferase [Verrucomicrobiota bacterium]